MNSFPSSDITRLTNAQIILRADALTLRQYRENVGPNYILEHGIDFGDVYHRVIAPEYGISWHENYNLGYCVDGKKILARYVPLANSVEIDSCIGVETGDPRRVFVLWHEFGGHGVLQGAWLRDQLKRPNRGIFMDVITTEATLGRNCIDKLERQANLFAANAAAPQWLVKMAMCKLLELNRKIRYIGPGEYWITAHGKTVPLQVTNIDDLYRWIAMIIQPMFGGLSIESLSYRVAESGYVLNNEQARAPFTLLRTSASRSDRATRTVPSDRFSRRYPTNRRRRIGSDRITDLCQPILAPPLMQ